MRQKTIFVISYLSTAKSNASIELGMKGNNNINKPKCWQKAKGVKTIWLANSKTRNISLTRNHDPTHLYICFPVYLSLFRFNESSREVVSNSILLQVKTQFWKMVICQCSFGAKIMLPYFLASKSFCFVFCSQDKKFTLRQKVKDYFFILLNFMLILSKRKYST